MKNSLINFELILSTITDGIVVVSQRGIVLYANESAENIFERGSLLGKDLAIPLSHREKYQDINLIRRSGIGWAELRSTPIMWGQQRAYVIAVRDITERKQMEMDLKISKLFNQSVLDSVASEIAVLDYDGVILAVNEPWRRSALENGVEPGKLGPVADVGANYLDALRKEAASTTYDLQETLDGILAVLNGRLSNFSLEYPCHSPQQKRWFRMNVTPMGDSKRGRVVITHDDISERVESEQKQCELSERISRYAAEVSDIYENAPCGYHSLDKDCVFLHINETELKWLGYKREEVVGKRKFCDLLTSESKLFFQGIFQSLKKVGKLKDFELEVICKDGRVLPVMISASVVYDDEGNFVMSRFTVYDVTERKKIEIERIGYLKRLEAVSHQLVASQESMRRRLSSELHDRTSPNLAAISINLNIIGTELSKVHAINLTERLEDAKALIIDTTISIREICSDMRPPLLDYAGLVAALESYAHQFSQRTGIVVKFDWVNRSARYSTELESLLFRIFQEALTNCAKHAQATTVRVTLSNGGKPIILSIADDGIGFEHDQLGKAGEIGLGMLNMREMAEVAGGRLAIESESGNGTTISVKIP